MGRSSCLSINGALLLGLILLASASQQAAAFGGHPLALGKLKLFFGSNGGESSSDTGSNGGDSSSSDSGSNGGDSSSSGSADTSAATQAEDSSDSAAGSTADASASSSAEGSASSTDGKCPADAAPLPDKADCPDGNSKWVAFLDGCKNVKPNTTGMT